MVLAAVILYLLNSNRADRVEHRKERQEWDARFKDLQTSHDTKIREFEARLSKIEGELRSETRRADSAETRLAAYLGRDTA